MIIKMTLSKARQQTRIIRISQIKKTFNYIRMRMEQATSPVRLSDIEAELLAKKDLKSQA